MTTQTQTKPEEKVIDAEFEEIADPPAANLAIPTKMSEQEALAAMAAHGMIVPLSTPEGLRQLYAMRQKMYAAILDENDYLWIVKYKDRDRGRQYIARNKADAVERAEALHGEVSASPIKSGIQKLAEALGISARCVLREERVYVGRKGVYCEYEALHERTGKIEQGVAFCGTDEKGGKISVHDMLTTSDTRAYNRAVLRLAAFGAVSAEEIVAGLGTGDPPEFVPEAGLNKEPDDIPSEDEDDVIAAWCAYHKAVMARDTAKRFLPDAKQEALAARVTRAAARRGDSKEAHKLGTVGLMWSGPAQDSSAHQFFHVATPSKKLLEAVRSAPEPEVEEKKDSLPGALGTPEAPPNGKSDAEGWDLTGNGKKDDAGLPKDLPERHESKEEAKAKEKEKPASSGIPQPNQSADEITVAQAKKVSLLMVDVLGSKEAAREWLAAEAHVQKSTQIRSNQYEVIMSVLKKKKEG